MKMLADYESILRQVRRLIAESTVFQSKPSLDEIFANHPRTIVALSHGTPLGWLPSIAVLGLEALSSGGHSRRPLGVMDNFFFHVPMIRELAHWITQAERPLSYQDISERFRSQEGIDLVLFPEGSNCFFGPPEEIQDFRSPRFIELALETNSPILIGVHRGSENWSATLPVPEVFLSKVNLLPEAVANFLEKRLRKTGLFTLPLIPRPMEQFEMRCELYQPTLTYDELSADPQRRREQLRVEGEFVRNRMSEMRKEILNSFN